MYTVWPWRPVGEFVHTPHGYTGIRLERWKALTRGSAPPSAGMAAHVVDLTHRYDEEGIARFEHRLPMFPGDTSYQTTEPDSNGALPPSTAQLLGFSPEDFVQRVE